MAAAIELEGLRKSHGRVTALDGLSLRVEPGEIFGLLGPNGAGKTSTLSIIMGLSAPEAGRVRALGLEPARSPRDLIELKRRAAYLPERLGFYDELTARRNLAFVGELNGLGGADLAGRVASALEELGLAAAADRKVGGFSRGMRQRLGLAELLLKAPELALLDEPTLGLDPEGVDQVADLITRLARERGVTVLWSSQSPDLAARLCDRVGLLGSGRLLASGTLDELAEASGRGRDLTEIYRHYFGL